MPQLIAMVIVVVGAMIYMFQTFGGTGDKIEGIAQKTSVITEINNIKNGLKLAARSEHIGDGTNDPADATSTLKGLSELAYFPEQINNQVINDAITGDDDNTYNAISFGGSETERGGMIIKLVPSKAISGAAMIPGIYVEFPSTGALGQNAAFLEAQVSSDLANVAFIDRTATSAVAGTAVRGTGSDLLKRTPADTTTSTTALASDGKFIIYFKDFGSNEVVK
jgi:hypothetical protein